jgi:hypothetical protein
MKIFNAIKANQNWARFKVNILCMRAREALTEPYLLERLSNYPVEGEWMFTACIANKNKKEDE